MKRASIIHAWLETLIVLLGFLPSLIPRFHPFTASADRVVRQVCGQSFNLCLTLLMAYIMFFLVFREITEKI